MISEHKQLLESLLAELKAALTEPYASDRAKVIDIENVTRRYRFFLENPGSFETAMRIVARARGKEI